MEELEMMVEETEVTDVVEETAETEELLDIEADDEESINGAQLAAGLVVIGLAGWKAIELGIKGAKKVKKWNDVRQIRKAEKLKAKYDAESETAEAYEEDIIDSEATVVETDNEG